MNRYSIQVLKDGEDLFHCVYEHATQQAVDFFYFLDDAKERVSFLEAGGAFDGFTPSFVLNKVAIPKSSDDINKIFTEIVNED